MNGFISYFEKFEELLPVIVASPELHAKWLNTLSYLENCGARKIAGCEHPTLVKEEMLKHASEEFRHAHHLKKQILKVHATPLENYSLDNLIGSWASLNYLQWLDLRCCCYLSQTIGLPRSSVKEIAYILVTYAIELRAGELYLLYDRILKKMQSRVTVKSILLEEKGHLDEMRAGIKTIPSGERYAEKVCLIEAELCQKWLQALGQKVLLSN